ncbi:NupC/NupG family nucleoside CNT transporter [Holophaga foetida]|uniref:NupC/NupG family nucleoside CNT transporter n=1 Tax=Holophaga foetida TaxID=35839 RepID=UPI0002471753|nr:nucleoside transporter C-terminal domain-containing protein [Holophaga foetida]
MSILQPVSGIFVLLFFAWLLSENRKGVKFGEAALGLAVTVALAFIMLKAPFARQVFYLLNRGVGLLEESTRAGTSFVFGYLGGGPLPFSEESPGSSFVFALQSLPIVLVISALSSLLFYWRILPVLVRVFSWFFQKTLRVGGAVGLSAAANIFLGMVESPLFIKPYLKEMTRSELFITMSCGMAGIAGTVMVLYASVLRNSVPDAIGHILIVSIISIPAAIVVSKIMVPETGRTTEGKLTPPQPATSSIDAIALGTTEGVALLINVVAMLIVLVALIALANGLLGLLPPLFGKPVSLQGLLGYIMAPVVWLIGIPWKEAPAAGALMGTKTILNEMIAYLDMAKLSTEALSPRSRFIMTYALCGFANLGSLGIMVGGLGSMAPERRNEIISLGIRSILSGTLATLITGAMAGMLY